MNTRRFSIASKFAQLDMRETMILFPSDGKTYQQLMGTIGSSLYRAGIQKGEYALKKAITIIQEDGKDKLDIGVSITRLSL